MHKKLEADLISLAHSILQMKNKENVFLLKQKSKEIYEKLSVLAFVEEYVNSTPNSKQTKEELTSIVEKGYEKKNLISNEVEDVKKPEPVKRTLVTEYLDVENEHLAAEIGDDFSGEDFADEDFNTVKIEQKKEETGKEIEAEAEEETNEYLEVEKEDEIEQPFDGLEGLIFGDTKPTNFKDDPKDVGGFKALTLEEELQDTIPVDVMANLFEPLKPTSLNDKLQTNIQIGLNDRIAFVKNLFEGSQEDFNRVISQLNTFKTEKEAKKFITKMVKPDYNWSEQEELENRLTAIIERRFA
ncbi:hypothetical protein CW731_08355 [Polaribacter sp. ALD11]|uniref:hypothetical protein n=1 Tax=Polaribacter sp. ALD11 TaxID=2058137 RepID=UPI000C319FFB|nr:hypothetical protein [Polaribacter sp. ALD11]AUC85301.1 hypothetical protein CW731_08355 [Polaribacter sp. ALD11]